MYKINNSLHNPNFEWVSDTHNREPTFEIVEHLRDYDETSDTAQSAYYRQRLNNRKRQLVCYLSRSPVNVQPGMVRWCVGEVGVIPPGKRGGGIKETTYKPEYVPKGDGILMLKPIYDHIIILDNMDWQEQLVVDDKYFLACESGLRQELSSRNNLSSSVTATKGNVYMLFGKGKTAIRSPIPEEFLNSIVIEKDILRLEDNRALAWSASLKMTVESAEDDSSESQLVFRGSGKVLLLP